jgi:hypothetical protein
MLKTEDNRAMKTNHLRVALISLLSALGRTIHDSRWGLMKALSPNGIFIHSTWFILRSNKMINDE